MYNAMPIIKAIVSAPSMDILRKKHANANRINPIHQSIIKTPLSFIYKTIIALIDKKSKLCKIKKTRIY